MEDNEEKYSLIENIMIPAGYTCLLGGVMIQGLLVILNMNLGYVFLDSFKATFENNTELFFASVAMLVLATIGISIQRRHMLHMLNPNIADITLVTTVAISSGAVAFAILALAI